MSDDLKAFARQKLQEEASYPPPDYLASPGDAPGLPPPAIAAVPPTPPGDMMQGLQGALDTPQGAPPATGMAPPIEPAGQVDPRALDAATNMVEPPGMRGGTMQQMGQNISNLDHQTRVNADKNAVRQTAAIQEDLAAKSDQAREETGEERQFSLNTQDEAVAQQLRDDENRAQAAVVAGNTHKVIDEMNTLYANQPQDFWGQTGANRVAGTIGLILSSLGGAATGGRNMAMESLQKMSAQNLAQQKFQYALLGQKAATMNNQYAQLRNLRMDDQTASNAHQAMSSASHAAVMKSIVGKHAPAQFKAQASKLIADAEAKAESDKEAAAQAAIANLHAQKQSAQVDRQITQADRAGDQKDQSLRLTADALLLKGELGKKGAEEVQPMPDLVQFPEGYVKQNKKETEEISAQTTALMRLHSLAKEYKETSVLDQSKRAGLVMDMQHVAGTFDTQSPRATRIGNASAAVQFGANSHAGLQGRHFVWDLDKQIADAIASRAESYKTRLAGSRSIPKGAIKKLLDEIDVKDISPESHSEVKAAGATGIPHKDV